MKINYDQKWFDWAAQVEDEADCDISAGLDYGQHLGKYLEMVVSKPKSISHSKLLSILHDKVGSFLPEEEIEKLANEIQAQVCEANIIKPRAA